MNVRDITLFSDRSKYHITAIGEVGPNKISLDVLCIINHLVNNAKIDPSITDYKVAQKNTLEKLQFSLSLNALSSLLDKDIDYVFRNAEAQVFIKYVITLLSQVTQELHLEPLRSYEQFQKISITEQDYSSLYRDMKANKPLETAAIIDATIDLVKILKEQSVSNHINLSVHPLYLLKRLLATKVAGFDITTSLCHLLFKECKFALINMANPAQPSIRARM